jgi:DNA-3-methyladenine glycosylase II
VASSASFSLAADGPLDVDKTLARYTLWGTDPANRVEPGRFRRAVRVAGQAHEYRVEWSGAPEATVLRVTVPGSRARDVSAAAAREVRRIFGLDADLPGFYRMAKADPALCGLIEPLYGMRPTLTPDPLEMLVGSVCAQQVNLTFAFSLRGRLVRRYGTPLSRGDDALYCFPEASALAGARMPDLRAMQFSQRKAEYIVGLARAIEAGEIDVTRLEDGANEENLTCLTGVRGFGRWTAEWFLARCLGRGDVCPAGDLAVRKAFARFYHRGRPVSEVAIRRRAKRWGDYQSLAVHYLLAGLRLTANTGGGT